MHASRNKMTSTLHTGVQKEPKVQTQEEEGKHRQDAAAQMRPKVGWGEGRYSMGL